MVRDDDASDGISDNDNTSSEAVGDSSVPDESSVQEEKSDPYDDPKYNGVAKLYITVKNTVTKEEYVPCTIQLLDPSGEYEEITDENGKIKVRGNSTSAGAKKPYNIKFSSSQRPLGLGKGKKFCLLANLYDKTLIRNRLSYDFGGRRMPLYTADGVCRRVSEQPFSRQLSDDAGCRRGQGKG